jgi:signal transduction histidine kinase
VLTSAVARCCANDAQQPSALAPEQIGIVRMTVEHDVLPRAMSLAVHELRTPVTVVAGYLRMLLREQAGPLTEKQRKMLEEADRSCSRLSHLVNEMSEFGKLHGGQITIARQDVDLHALAVEVAADMHEGNDRGVRLEVRDSGPVVVTGDRARLSAALKALMHSALRERGEPGTVTVECTTSSGTPAWGVVAIGDASMLADLARAAADTPPPFDEWRGGMGLALPVARRVIEAHGGDLWSATHEHSRAASALRVPLRT